MSVPSPESTEPSLVSPGLADLTLAFPLLAQTYPGDGGDGLLPALDVCLCFSADCAIALSTSTKSVHLPAAATRNDPGDLPPHCLARGPLITRRSSPGRSTIRVPWSSQIAHPSSLGRAFVERRAVTDHHKDSGTIAEHELIIVCRLV